MSPAGYEAFVAWCIAHGVSPCGRELYESWSTRRLERYMREQFKRRDTPNGENVLPLF